MRVLVVDHHDSYTWNLVHLIAGDTGALPDVVEHDAEVSLAGYTHVVLSPGPGNPTNPADFANPWIFGAGIPVFGVCLGMQALVTTFGGTVAPISPAHGTMSRITHYGTGIFAGLPDGFEAVRYHSLAAAVVPPDLKVTAQADGIVMGVQHRTLPLHGVQFHPESILSEHGALLVRNFLESP